LAELIVGGQQALSAGMSGLTAAALAGLSGGRRRSTFAAKATRRRGQGGVAGIGPQPGPGVAQLLLELANLFLLLPRLGEEVVDLGLELAVGGLQLSDALLGVVSFHPGTDGHHSQMEARMPRRTMGRHCVVALFCLSLLLFLPASQAQDAESTNKVAERARALLKKKGFVPEQFPKGAIDPSKYDPLLLVGTWNRARPELEKLLQEELRLGEGKKPDLRLVFTPDKKEKKHYHTAFRDQPEAVKKVLRAALPLHDGSFIAVRLKQPYASHFISRRDFGAAYLNEGGVNFPEVGKALGNMKRPGLLKDAKVDLVSQKGRYLYAKSALVRVEGSPVEGGTYWAGLEYGISRAKFGEGELWELFAFFQIVFLPKSDGNDAESAEKFGRDIGISDRQLDLADSLVFVNGAGIATPSSELSSLYKLSIQLLDQMKTELTKKGREK
jgi:hypothetical protein